MPTLAEGLDHARKIGLGLVVEVKESRNLDGVVDRLADLIETAGFNEHAILISFDHAFLKSAKHRLAGLRAEGIVHARHADIAAVARTADLDSVSIEHMMFRPEDGEALHRAGVAVRFHLQRPAYYDRYAAAGIDLLPDVKAWIAGGFIDTISGDDVGFLASASRREARPGAPGLRRPWDGGQPPIVGLGGLTSRQILGIYAWYSRLSRGAVRRWSIGGAGERRFTLGSQAVPWGSPGEDRRHYRRPP